MDQALGAGTPSDSDQAYTASRWCASDCGKQLRNELLSVLVEIGRRPGARIGEGERRNLPVNHQCARLQPGNVQRGYVVIKPYQVLPPTAPVPAPDDVLEIVVREGARKMLQDALEAEVDDFLGRHRSQRTGD